MLGGGAGVSLGLVDGRALGGGALGEEDVDVVAVAVTTGSSAMAMPATRCSASRSPAPIAPCT